MMQPVWINLRAIKAFHDRQIIEHGGLPDLRDEGLLISALSRPQNLYNYSDPKPDISDLVAAYAFGLSKNHPFNDANKRTELAALHLFLKTKKHDLGANVHEKYTVIIQVAVGKMGEAILVVLMKSLSIMVG